jgi:hypothetical protein
MFHAEVNFKKASVQIPPNFDYASFDEELRFERTRWHEKTVNLRNARINGELILTGSTNGAFRLEGTTVGTLVYDATWMQRAQHSSLPPASLAGLNFARLAPSGETKDLLDQLIERIKPTADITTRQRLVRVLIRQGLEEQARDAERSLRRAGRHRLSSFEYLIDLIYDRLFGYGNSPWLGLSVPLLIWVAGTCLYSQDKAVVWRMDTEHREAVTLTCEPQIGNERWKCIAQNNSRGQDIEAWQAAAVSLHYILPGDVPLGKDFEPSSEHSPIWFTYDAFATFQRAIGWIWTPILIAAMAHAIWRGRNEEHANEELD